MKQKSKQQQQQQQQQETKQINEVKIFFEKSNEPCANSWIVDVYYYHYIVYKNVHSIKKINNNFKIASVSPERK